MNYLEQVIQFSERRGLVGVLTTPAQSEDNTNRPAILLLNAGLVHRVGPYRMHVTLARRLVEHGFTVFRFDLSGIGDSQVATGDAGYREQTVTDVRAAMDMLARNFGVRRFVSVGLCSGAMNTHTAAVDDERILGAILLDAYGYKTRRFLINHYAPRLAKIVNPAKLLRLIGSSPGIRKTEGIEGIDYLDFPPKRQVEENLQQLINRGIRMLFIYTGGVSYYYNYAEQLWDNFPFLRNSGLVDLHYFPGTDHTFTLLDDREQLFDQVEGWLRENFSS